MKTRGVIWNSVAAVARRRSGAWVRAGLALTTLLFWVSASSFAAETPVSATAKLRQKVIYFGELDTPRAKDFLHFLGRHFRAVGSGRLEAFRESMAEGYDVVILDYGELKLSNNRIQLPSNPVSRQFRRPTITIGATGALVSGRLGLKTGYL